MRTVAEPERLVLSPQLAGTLMTPAEFDAAEDSDGEWVHELIHGVLVVSPPPLESERGPNDHLGYWLLAYKYEHPQGCHLDETLPEQWVRTSDSRRRADRVIWAGLGRQPDPPRDRPNIVVEFVSSGKRNRIRDYQDKRAEYLEAGIDEYWIIDRFRRLMTVCRRRGKDLVIKEGETYTSKLLPDFALDLARLLAVADRWKQRKS